MAYKLKLGVWGSVFAVPSCVVDNYIKIASGEQIKVLLYLLKNPGISLSADDISAMTGISSDTVEEALIFWEQRDVISERDGEITPKEGTPAVSVSNIPVVSERISERDRAAIRAKLNSDVQIPPKEIAKIVNRDEAFRCLCTTFEKLKGEPPNHTEQNTLMILVENYALPAEVALMLVEYSFSVNKAKPAYLKKVAADWMECGIDTISKAEERILTLKSQHTLENKLRSKFQLGSAFSKSQKEIIAGWAEEGFSDELIDEAYDVTM